MENRTNIHPGEVLREEFLLPMDITAYRLSKEIDVPQTRISAILREKRSITADTALRLSRYFKTTAQFWLNLQNLYDLEDAATKQGIDISKLPEFQIPVVSSTVG